MTGVEVCYFVLYGRENPGSQYLSQGMNDKKE